MEFEEVIEKSRDVESFNENVEKYLESHNIVDSEERRKHYWALFYRWKEKIKAEADKV